MITKIKSDKIITPCGLFDGYVYFENGKISSVTADDIPADKEYDRTSYYVSPGFIDLHTHGGAGHEFFGESTDIVEGCNYHLSHGTTTILPTISAAPLEIMQKSVDSFIKAKNNPNLKSNALGLHFEGPYLSKAQCGAQNTDFITPPIKSEYEPLVKRAGGFIKRWTYAPENDKNGEFCRFITEHGILASAGHTDAIYDDMLLAEQNGCKLITHLYSCTSTITRNKGFRRLGVIESAYLSDDLYTEIIADGKHLPAELIKLIVKIKGTDKVSLCTDSLALAGTGLKKGTTLNTEFIIEDGVCKLADRSAFAGSIATADRLVKVVYKDVGLSIVEAVKMITDVPAKIMGLNKGRLEKGKDADIVVFDDDISIKDVFVMGNKQ